MPGLKLCMSNSAWHYLVHDWTLMGLIPREARHINKPIIRTRPIPKTQGQNKIMLKTENLGHFTQIGPTWILQVLNHSTRASLPPNLPWIHWNSMFLWASIKGHLWSSYLRPLFFDCLRGLINWKDLKFPDQHNSFSDKWGANRLVIEPRNLVRLVCTMLRVGTSMKNKLQRPTSQNKTKSHSWPKQ